MTTEDERMHKAYRSFREDIGEYIIKDAPFVWREAWQAALSTQPAPQPNPDAEQAAFEDWLRRKFPSGDCESVHSQWLKSSDYADLLDDRPAPQEVQQVMEAVKRLDASAAFDGKHDRHPSMHTEQIYERVKQAITTMARERGYFKKAYELIRDTDLVVSASLDQEREIAKLKKERDNLRAQLIGQTCYVPEPKK